MRRILTLAAVLTLFQGGLRAALPSTLNYQGRIRLTSGAPVPDSTGNTVFFTIFDAPTGGSVLWNEIWGTGSSCVTTTAGLFNVVLGSFAPLNLPFDQPYYLQITWYNGATPETMSPRQPLTSS